jgi:hypothetical protein
MSRSRSLRIVDGFAAEAHKLRRVFDERFADPRRARGDRFVWDYWHVPGQYTALRTPAWQYFPKRLYEAFHRRLVGWGREHLGCHDVSPPWLSLYVEGCRQELHGDLPHGPFAFVYSLTPEPRAFRGGETLLLGEAVLDWWSDFVSTRSVEEAELVRAVKPRFDRLIVFDPRIPHGVRRVEGTHDPRAGRLVIHGWFVQPRPFVSGPLPAAALAERLPLVERAVAPHLGAVPVAGALALRFAVSAHGVPSPPRVLTDNTRVPPAFERARRRLLRTIAAAISALRFPRARAVSYVTLPLVFERHGRPRRSPSARAGPD